MMTQEQEYLTLEEVAAKMGVAVTTVRYWVNQGYAPTDQRMPLRSTKLFGKLVVRRDDTERLAQARLSKED